MVLLIQATSELALGLQGPEDKVVTFGLGAGGVPFLLSATEATGYAGLAVLVSQLSRHLLCVSKCCGRIKKRGAGGTQQTVLTGLQFKRQIDIVWQFLGQETCLLQKGINCMVGSNGIRKVWLGLRKSHSRPPSPPSSQLSLSGSSFCLGSKLAEAKGSAPVDKLCWCLLAEK